MRRDRPGPRSSANFLASSRVESRMLLAIQCAMARASVEGGIHVAKQAFKDRAGIHVHGHRRIGILPGNVIRVRAARAGVAIADHAAVFAAELERREAGFFPMRRRRSGRRRCRT